MAFKPYCWSVGTTSFRVKQLNYKIEKQLQMLNRLYSENDGSSWDVDLQLKYYEIMLDESFVEDMRSTPSLYSNISRILTLCVYCSILTAKQLKYSSLMKIRKFYKC